MSRAPGAAGIGGILVERDTPGFRIGERDHTMGLRGIPEGGCTSTAAASRSEQVLVGPPDGFKQLMQAYNSQRLGAATVALGLAQGAYELALAYAGSGGSSGGPSASSRASAGSSPTWRSSSTRPGS